MSTITSPRRDSPVSNESNEDSSSTSQTESSVTSTLLASSPRSSCSPALATEISPLSQAGTSSSFLETILTFLQHLQTTIWTYILSLLSFIHQYVEQYSQKGDVKVEGNELEKPKDLVPEIVGRSRTGTNVRELAMIGGSKRGSMDELRKRSSLQNVNSSQSLRPRASAKSTKGTGFQEPFCTCK